MPTAATLIAFAFVALGLVVTPGPGMIYYVSRSICQGTEAGLISLAGGTTGLIVYILGAAFGITALIFAMPHVYGMLKIAGAAYLVYLAWQAIGPAARSPFQVRKLPIDRPGRLYRMGLVTILLNPKVGIFYLSLLPQFIDPQRGSFLTQALVLGCLHMTLAIIGNSIFILTAGKVAKFFAANPMWLLAQRWVMGLILIGVAFHIMFVGQ